MTDLERQAAEADRLLADLKPYFDKLEREAVEAWLSKDDQTQRHFVLAIRELQGSLRQAIVAGKQSARKAPTVA